MLGAWNSRKQWLVTIIRQSTRRLNLDSSSYEDIPRNKIPLIPSSWNLTLNGGAAYLHEHCDKLHRKLGPIFRENIGIHELIFISDTQMIQNVIANEGIYPNHNVPEAWLLYNNFRNIERGLFFQHGEAWARMRKAFNKVMLEEATSTTKFSGDLLDITSHYLDSWQRYKRNQQSFLVENLKDDLCKWSIETTGFVLFGHRLGCIDYNNNLMDPRAQRLVSSVAKMFEETSRFQVIPCRLAYKLGLPSWKRFVKASDDMLSVSNSYVDEYIQLTKQGGSVSAKGVVQDLLDMNYLSDEEISRSLVDLLIAAADTTSNSVQWMLYLVAKYQDVQSRLWSEIAPLFSNEGFKIDWDRLSYQAPYLKAFMKEASRLYPTAPFLARTLDHDIVLGGYKVPAGKPIVLSLYTTSRMDRYFDSPNEFKPERWIKRRYANQCPISTAKSAFASLPFGHGRRRCIGSRAAELEMSLIVALFVAKYKSRLPENLNYIGIRLKMILSPSTPIQLILEPRKSIS